MLMTVFLLLSSTADVGPPCSVTSSPVAMRLQELPADVQAALADRLADRGAPFNVTDYVTVETADLPFRRLICGYSIPQGYVVEREEGGRGYNIRKIVFDRRAGGYVERK